MNARQFEQAITREAQSWPGVSLSWTRCKRHPAVVFRYGRHETLMPYPGSSGDRKAVLAQITAMRQALRNLGAIRTLERKSSRPRTIRNPRPAEPRTIPALPEGPTSRLSIDPWARLKAMFNQTAETDTDISYAAPQQG